MEFRQSMQAIGRYKTIKKIGSGSQGAVYLCEDTSLKRRVAVKLLDNQLADKQDAADAFEQEVMALGNIQHQNIVSVCDAGQHDKQPYIVFEYIEGQLLSERISRSDMKLPQAVELMTAIASGVAKAHEAGVVHRDLKPQNIILTEDNVPKVMDFGIAMLIDGNAGNEYPAGTPRYMAPEYIRKKQISQAVDVFSLGAVFYEMLTGNPAFAGDSTKDVLARILIGPPSRPSAVNELADDVVDGICLKALAANSKDRFQDAGSLFDVLSDYLQDHLNVVVTQGQPTLEFLYRRMQRKKDFPALAESIRSINQLQSSSEKDAEKLASLIINDFALTNKILKVVNSAYYGSFSGKISTISRAIVVLGVDAVRSIAASLIFFEHMSNRAVASKLKHLMASSLFRAIFAEEMSTAAGIRDLEESFLCAMFHQLGAALVAYYLPEEDLEIDHMLARGGCSLSEAAKDVMGVTYEEVGAFVARQWNFPGVIVQSMQPLEAGQLPKPRSDEDRYRLITDMADNATRLLTRNAPLEELKKLVRSYSEVLPVKQEAIENVLDKARENFSRMAEKLLKDNPGDDYLMRLQGEAQERVLSRKSQSSGINIDSALNDECCEDETAALDPEGILSRGLQEATAILLETGDVSQVFNTVLETLYRAMAFRRVVLCLLKGKSYTGRMGFGEDIKDVLAGFQVIMGGQHDVFSLSLKKGVDVYIADVNDEKIRKDLPEWFLNQTDAASFVLFPLVMKGRTIGFIYGEYASTGQMQLEAKTFSLIKSLRNQMILALQQN